MLFIAYFIRHTKPHQYDPATYLFHTYLYHFNLILNMLINFSTVHSLGTFCAIWKNFFIFSNRHALFILISSKVMLNNIAHKK